MRSTNIIAHDSTIQNTPPHNARRYANRPSSTTSLIGGIDSEDRWKTSNQLPIQTGNGRQSYKKQSAYGKESHEFGVTPIERLRKQLFERGSYGISGLARKFKSMDDDGSRSLSMQEFKKAIIEFGLDFTGPEIVELFNTFDRDKSGTIDYDEFLVRIRGKLNQRRKDLVFLAFQRIDKDGNGELNIDDIINVYDASQHPDVISGKKKAEEVLLEFLETFDVGGEVDGKVTLSEFENYYANISASIDDDDYFELMIRNAWHISGGEGWCANTSNRRVLVTDSSGNQRVEEIKDDMGLRADDKSGMMARLRAQGVNATNIELHSGGEHGIGGKAAPPRAPPSRRGVSRSFAHDTVASTSYIPSTGYLSKGNEVNLNRPGSAGYQNLSRNVSNNISRPPSVDAASLISYNHPTLEQLRNQLKARGANGISGLSRAFRKMDFDGSKSLTFDEFSRALTETGLSITDPDKRKLFLFFDRDRGGTVDYNEFLVGIRGILNDRRKRLVKMAFQKFDRDGNGVIDIQDVIGVYDASKHPDVVSGKRTAGQVLMEFIEGFDVGGEVDGKVTLSEFENYYANISASIDDDDYFELMIRNAWHISGGEGWCANTSNRRVLVTDSSGNQRVEEIKDDMGLRADDKSGMMARLQAQGVDVSNLNVTDAIDNTSAAKKSSLKPTSESYSRATPISAQNDPKITHQSRVDAPGVYPGMVLPNGLIVKEIRNHSNSATTGGLNSTSRPASAPHGQSVPLPGPDRDRFKEKKHSAFRLYSQKNYRAAEVAYMECLQLLLELNGNQVKDPEYIKGVDNVNKCREKLGLKKMTIDAKDEQEEYEEW